MKDSRIGSYGAVGLALVLLAKITTLAALTESNVETAVRALVVGHVLGRWSSLPLIHVLPYVRDDAGKSRPFAAGVTRWRLTIGTAIAFAAVSSALAPLGLRAILVIVAWAIIAMTISAGYFRRRLGGMTGDCLGAANQLIEVTTYLLLASAWIRQ
jgi:adenosylcobinamide-GDP ribazoletransferase